MRLPDGFSIRPPRAQDAEGLVEMMNDESEALVGARVADTDWLTSAWSDPAARVEEDFAVVLDADDTIAGYVMVQADPPYTEVFSIGAVGLPYQGRGLGAALVAEAERRAARFVALAPPGERIVIHAGALAGEPRVAALMSAQGYREVRRFWLMRLQFDDPQPPPAQIDGVDVRRMAENEQTAVYSCLADAFQDHWGTGFPDEDSWMHHHRNMTGYDPDLWWVAHDGAGVVGALIARPSFAEDPELGYIAEVGVLRSHRGRGIARALLRSSFAQLVVCGKTGAALHVDSESSTGATRLYESVGMTAQPRFSHWEKQLRPAG